MPDDGGFERADTSARIGAMRLQKRSHACLVVDTAGARLVIDPGGFSPGAEDVDGVTAVLLTHQHADHVDVDRLRALLDRNAGAQVVADVGTAQRLRDDAGLEATVAEPGDVLELGGARVEVVGDGLHAEIHPDLPRVPNVGYLVDGRLLHPGDALTVPDRPVEILAVPAVAPWMRVADAVDYLRAVRPRVAVPIHEAVAAVPQLYYGQLRDLGPEGTELRVLDDGDPVEL